MSKKKQQMNTSAKKQQKHGEKSVKKQPKKETKPVNMQSELEVKKQKKPIKGIIIAAAAIVLAAAVILTVIFVVKPAVENKNETTTAASLGGEATPSDSSSYVYGKYKGVDMPQEFVDILNQSERDRVEACKKYGTAAVIGGVEISKPEFMSYYLDEQEKKKQDVNYSIEQYGRNMTGYEIETFPDEQNCPNAGYTWAEDFTRDAIAAIQEDYETFDKALEKKIMFTDSEIKTIISEYSMISVYSKQNNMTYDEMFSRVYGEGYVESMYKSRKIKLYYKQKYMETVMRELYGSYSDDDLLKKFNEDANAYTEITGRVYPIEGEYSAAEVAKISTEKEFLEFAVNNRSIENFPAEKETLCCNVSRQELSEAFCDAVAQWMFSDEREAGEISVVKGQLLYYLVYIKELPHIDTSRKIMYYAYEYYDGISSEEIENGRSALQKKYDDWKADGAKKEDFEALCNENDGYSEYDAYTGEFHYAAEEWIFDKDRKNGDHVFIDTEVGCVALYYLGENEDDYEWKYNVRNDLSESDYLEKYNEDIEKNYTAERNDKVISKIYKDSNVIIAREISENKEKETEA